jgi:predicted ATP-grasp superfamily ATP-dependent carboligase
LNFTFLTLEQVVERGEASHAVRIYGNKNVVVFASENSLDTELQHDVVDAILDFGERHRCKLILSVLGLDSDPEKREKFSLKMKDDPEDGMGEEMEEEGPQTKEDLIKMIEDAKLKRDEKLWFCTNNKEFAEKLIKMEHKPLQDVILAGVSAGLLAESSYTELTICCLFSKMNELQKYISVDARAAISLIMCINSILGDSVILDIKEMDKDVTKLEEGMVKIITRFSGLSSKRLDSHLYL